MTELGFPCDWPLCFTALASQDELDAHGREHWTKEDALGAWQRRNNKTDGMNARTPGPGDRGELTMTDLTDAEQGDIKANLDYLERHGNADAEDLNRARAYLVTAYGRDVVAAVDPDRVWMLDGPGARKRRPLVSDATIAEAAAMEERDQLAGGFPWEVADHPDHNLPGGWHRGQIR